MRPPHPVYWIGLVGAAVVLAFGDDRLISIGLVLTAALIVAAIGETYEAH